MESTLCLLVWRSWEGWGGCWSILFDFASLGLGCLAAADREEVDSAFLFFMNFIDLFW